MVQHVGEDVLEELLGQIGQPVQVAESHLGLHHPELGQMAGRVGIFRPEGRTERVNIRKGQGEDFRFQLTADRKEGGLAEKVLFGVDSSVLHGHVCQVQGRYPEHGPGALGVAGGDHGGLQEQESLVLEKAVYRVGQGVSNAGHGAKGIGSGPKVGDITKKLNGVPFLLQRIRVRVGLADDLDGLGVDLVLLAFAGRLDQCSDNADAATGGQGIDRLEIGERFVGHHLNIRQGGAVANLDEGYGFGRTPGLDPALYQNVATGAFPPQNFLYLTALHRPYLLGPILAFG